MFARVIEGVKFFECGTVIENIRNFKCHNWALYKTDIVESFAADGSNYLKPVTTGSCSLIMYQRCIYECKT